MKKLILVLAVLFSLFIPATTLADGLFSHACTDTGTSESAVCNSQSSTNPISGPHGAILRVVRFIALIAGIAAVIVIIIGSIRFITSSGDSNSVSSAKQTILYALIGLVIIVIGQSIIAFVIKKL